MDMKRKEAVPGIPRRTARPAAPRKSASSAGGEHESQRQQMIAEAAYYRAEQRGFEPGQEMADWLQAEADVERALGSST